MIYIVWQTFYKALSLKAKGKYIIKVCNGTACHIRGSNKLIEEITEVLSILPGENYRRWIIFN